MKISLFKIIADFENVTVILCIRNKLNYLLKGLTLFTLITFSICIYFKSSFI